MVNDKLAEWYIGTNWTCYWYWPKNIMSCIYLNIISVTLSSAQK